MKANSKKSPRKRPAKKSSASKAAAVPRRAYPANPAFEIAGQSIEPGTRQRFEIPIARLQTDSEASLPICVLHGTRPGPTIWTSAAVHGDELNGVEIIRQLLHELDPAEMSGTLIAVPIVNVFGFLNQSRYLPDRRDLNRCFPGSARGSLAARLAHIFVSEIVKRCTLGIDLHTGSDARSNLPQIRADLDDPVTRKLAEAFAAPVLLGAGLRDGSLRKVAAKWGARVLLYEAGEPLKFSEHAIETGVSGIKRVLKQLKMLKDAPKAEAPSALSKSSQWVRAARSGLYRSRRELGDRVKRGETLGLVSTPYGTAHTLIKSPVDGILIGTVTNPLVFQGDALVHVAETVKRSVRKSPSTKASVTATKPSATAKKKSGSAKSTGPKKVK